MKVDTTREHQWLQQFVGEWKSEMRAIGKPGEPEHHHTGSEIVRTMGDAWIIADGTGDDPGGGTPVRMQLLLGYDITKKKFVGTWAGSMATYLWVYEGELDDNRTRLTLHCTGPAMFSETPGATANYRDVHVMTADGKRSMESHTQDDTGRWHQFMTVTYTRE